MNWFKNLGSANAGVISSHNGAIYSITVDNENAADHYLLVFDQTSTPVNNDVPIFALRCTTAKQSGVGIPTFGKEGLRFTTGIAWAWSSTKDLLTLGTASDQTTHIGWA